MTNTELPERSLAAVHWNRRGRRSGDPLIISRRKDGRLTDTFHRMTHGEYERLALHLAAGLAARGFQPGDHLAIFFAQPPAMVAGGVGDH
ncbi:MAG: hypothetical protein M5R36_17275 [Deltaproteobacteria bacterium]|nr:hypothetical protein [Deltaproteobacteria bacterium]